MLSYIILFVVSCVVLIKKHCKKDIAPVILAYSFLAPCMPIGGLRFDSSYVFLMIVFFITIVPTFQIRRYKEIKPLNLLMAMWIIFYTLGWVNSGLQVPKQYIISILGLCKTVIAVWLAFENFSGNTKRELEYMAGKTLSIVLALNVFMVFFQWLIPIQMYNLCYTLYYSADSTGYASLETMNQWGGGFYQGHYYRYFGLFETPMTFSCFLILVLIFYVIQCSSGKKFFKHPKIVLLADVICGLMAQCKIYIMILPIVLLIYLIYNYQRLTRNQIFSYAFVGVLGVLLIGNIEKIPLLQGYLGTKLTYFTNPIATFATRFGSGEGNGYLTKTLAIAKANFLTGVGPISINGEPLADSSYVVLLHNGGILAIISLIVFYTWLLRKNVKINERCLNMALLVLFFIGLSRTELIFGSVLIFLMTYILEEHRISRVEMNFGVDE